MAGVEVGAAAEDADQTRIDGVNDIELKARDVQTAYWFGDVVFHRIKEEKVRGMITGINLKPVGATFLVMWADGKELWHFDFELTNEYLPEFG